MLQRWTVLWRENAYVTEVVQFNGGSKIMLGGQFNRGRMVMLRRWSF